MTETTPSLDSHERIVEAFYRIGHSIQRVTELPELLQTIMNESKHLLGSGASSLFLYDAERNDLCIQQVVGGDEEIVSIRVPIDQGIVGAAARERRTQIVNDCASDSRHFKINTDSGMVIRNLIASPMILGERLIGVLEVLNREKGDFDEMDAKVLGILADQAAVQIENTRLIRAKVQAERLTALGEAAAKLAHSIKNILFCWKGSAGLIEQALEEREIENIANLWPVLKRANDSIAKLVQDMLMISRERTPERKPTNLNSLMEAIAQQCREKADRAGVELGTQLDPDAPETSVDPSAMQDVLLNLTVNAIQAIEEAKVSDGRITLISSFDGGGKKITLQVRDNGPGIPEEVQNRVFEPFFSTKGSKGTGLGLAVAVKTVAEHGGKLSLQSAPWQGSTFTIELPLA